MSPDDKTIYISLHELFPIIKSVLDEGQCFTLTVRGNSMFPFLRDMRDQAVFAPLGDRKIRCGDVVFYQRDNGQFVMHRVFKVDENGVMTIVGDAQWVLEPGIRPDQLRAFVPEVIRKDKKVSCESGARHRLMILWMKVRIRFPRLTRFGWRGLYYIYRHVIKPFRKA